MALALFFVLLLVGALLAASVFWIAMLWLLGEQAHDPEAAAQSPLTLSLRIARELEAHALWRSLSAWMSTKPPRLEHHRSDRHAG